MAVKKSEFVSIVAENTGHTKTDTEQMVNAMIATIKDILVSGEDLYLAGFGTLSTEQKIVQSRKDQSRKTKSYIYPVFTPDIEGVDGVAFREVFGFVNALNNVARS